MSMDCGAGPGGAYPRALQQWDENGFNELSLGLLFCVLGGSWLLGEWFLGHSLPIIWVAGLSLVQGGATFAAGAKVDGVIWVMLGIGVAMSLEGTLRLKRFLADPSGD